jgi:hypothetical protein
MASEQSSKREDPLSGESLDELLAAVGDRVMGKISHRSRNRRRWVRGGAATFGAMVLFAAGLWTGGAVFAASPPPANPTTTDPTSSNYATIECFTSASATTPLVTAAFTDKTNEGGALAHSVEVCQAGLRGSSDRDLPAIYDGPTAVCQVSASMVKVYPLDGRAADSFCGSKGLETSKQATPLER